MPYHSFINNDVSKNEQELPQNVQNERKISNHLALNHPNYHSAENKLQNQRLKRDTNSLIDEYDEYNDQNDGMLLWLNLLCSIIMGSKNILTQIRGLMLSFLIPNIAPNWSREMLRL